MAFAKEIEDFLNGYSTMQKIGQDQQSSKIEKEKWELQKEQLIQQQMEALATDPTAIPGSGKTKKIKKPKVDEYAAEPTADDPAGGTADSGEPPTFYANGGAVEAIPSYASGGAVAVESPHATGIFAGFDKRNRGVRPTIFNPHPDQPVREAIPGQPGAYRDTGQVAKYAGEGTGKAVKAAVDSFSQDMQGRAAIGGSEPEVDFLTGKGAATPEEIRAIQTKIDPNGQMDAITKGRATLTEAYNFWMSKGFPEKAANVAKRILLFDKNQSMAKGSMALQMMQNGNVNEGMKVLSDAYNQHFHDNKMIQYQDNGDGTISYQFVDDSGTPVEQGTANQQQASAMAKTVADGSQFNATTVQAADDEAQKEAGQAPDAGTAAPAAAAAPAVPDQPAATPATPAVTPEVTAPAATTPAAAAPAESTEPAAEEATEPAGAEATEAVPTGATGDTTAPAPDKTGAAPAAPKRAQINEDTATSRFEYYSSVDNMYKKMKEDGGTLTPEQKKDWAEAKRLKRQYKETALDLSDRNVKRDYKSKNRRDENKYLMELAAGAEEIDPAEYEQWRTTTAAAANDKNLRAPTPDELAKAQAKLDAGDDPAIVQAFLRNAGINPSGLQ